MASWSVTQDFEWGKSVDSPAGGGFQFQTGPQLFVICWLQGRSEKKMGRLSHSTPNRGWHLLDMKLTLW